MAPLSMLIITAVQLRFVPFSALVPTRCPRGGDESGPYRCIPKASTVLGSATNVARDWEKGGTADTKKSFPGISLLSPNTEAPLVTSGKSRPLDLLLDKGLEVMGRSQRGHDFPRTAGSYPSMDAGILG